MQNSIEFSLSVDMFKGIPFDMYDKDFTFIVNGQEFHTSRFLADLISPKIRQYHSIDKTMNKFSIDFQVDDSNLSFSDFLSAVSAEKKQITEEQLKYYIHILFLLGNRDIIAKSFPIMKEKITINNVFDRILYKIEYFNQFSKSDISPNSNATQVEPDIEISMNLFQDEIDFIASHFSDVNENKIMALYPSFIEAIIANEKLLLENEDSLLNFVISICSEKADMTYLYEQIDFLNVSQEGMKLFYKAFDISQLNDKIWMQLFERLTENSSQKVGYKHKYIIKEKDDKDEKDEKKQLELGEKEIHVTFSAPNGEEMRFKCKLSETINSYREVLAENLYLFDPEKIQLMYEGYAIYDNNETFESMNVQDGAIIYVLFKFPAG